MLALPPHPPGDAELLSKTLGEGVQSRESWLLSWQLAGSIDLSPIPKIPTRPSFAKAYLGIHQSRCVGPPFPFLHQRRVVAPTHSGSTQ